MCQIASIDLIQTKPFALYKFEFSIWTTSICLLLLFTLYLFVIILESFSDEKMISTSFEYLTQFKSEFLLSNTFLNHFYYGARINNMFARVVIK